MLVALSRGMREMRRAMGYSMSERYYHEKSEDET